MAETPAGSKAPTHRSPNYPGVDLRFAVERAQRLWKEQQHHPAAREVVMQNLGYTPKSGAGSVTYGALKRFGLLSDAESGGTGLSTLGLAIVKGEESGQRDYENLRAAALHPGIHRQMWDKYGADLPGDVTLSFELAEIGFTQKGAGDFSAQWKRTMAFARLADSPDSVLVDAEQPSEAAAKPVNPASVAGLSAPVPQEVSSPPASNSLGTLSLPIQGGGWATLQAPFPMSKQSWSHLLSVLHALTPAATEPETTPAQDSSEADSEDDS